jgi:hypothetical protein
MDEMVQEVEEVVEPSSDGGEVTEPEGGAEPATPVDPYSSKAAREFSQWLKGHRDTDPNGATHFRTAKDAFSEAYALRQLEKNGLNGVREKYALLDSVIHNDPERGELKGADAIAALQDSVRSYAEMDEQLAAGDPRALDSLGEEFNGGLAKLAPVILDRIAGSDPEAYAAAVLPHFVKAMAGSEMIASFNNMVDVLKEQPPAWLTEDQKRAWAADQQKRVINHAASMSGWFNAQWEKAKGLPQPGGNVPHGTQPKKDPLSEREAAFNKREQEAHWNSNISPKLDEHAGKSFTQLFQPFAKRLNLDGTTTQALKMEFSKRVAQAAAKDQAYMGQIARYRGMKNPDPATVLNYAKVNFDKHAKTVMESLVNERYKPFLNGKPRGAQPGNTNAAGKAAPPPAKGVQIVTVRPANVDLKRTPIDWIHQKKYYTTDGKIVQVRA